MSTVLTSTSRPYDAAGRFKNIITLKLRAKTVMFEIKDMFANICLLRQQLKAYTVWRDNRFNACHAKGIC